MLLLTTLLQASVATALPKVGGAIGAGIVALAAAYPALAVYSFGINLDF